MTEKDNGIRGSYAAAFSMLLGEDGRLRVFLDLLRSTGPSEHRRAWRHDLFVTLTVIDREKVVNGEFSPDELQKIGQLVVSELAILCRMESEAI